MKFTEHPLLPRVLPLLMLLTSWTSLEHYAQDNLYIFNPIFGF